VSIRAKRPVEGQEAQEAQWRTKMIVKSLSGIMSPRRRPKQYRAVDAPYAVGGQKGWYMSSFPRAYPITSQQRRVKNVASECGIRSGMAKRDLMTAMKDCVGPKMKRGG